MRQTIGSMVERPGGAGKWLGGRRTSLGGRGRWLRAKGVQLAGLRLLGLAAFVLTEERATLLLLPNLFEFRFVFVAARDRFRPQFALTPRRTVGALALLLALKLPHSPFCWLGRRLLIPWSRCDQVPLCGRHR